MKFRRSILPLAFLAVLCPAAAHGDTVSAGASPLFTLTPSADTVILNSASTTFSVTASSPAFFEQDGVFTVGNSGSQVTDATYQWTELVTIDSMTQSILITFDDDVSITDDNLTIDATAPITFGSFTFALEGTSIDALVNTTANIALIGDINLAPVSAVPEPSSIFLLSAGILATAGAVRRRFNFRLAA